MQNRTMRPEADWWRCESSGLHLRSELAIGHAPIRPSVDIYLAAETRRDV
jgi:hypothetical protein